MTQSNQIPGLLGVEKKKSKAKQSILCPCCCVNLLMLVYCKLYWCVSLVNCTDLVLVNTGFYFVFWAKSAIMSNRRKKINEIKNDKMEIRLSTFLSKKYNQSFSGFKVSMLCPDKKFCKLTMAFMEPEHTHTHTDSRTMEIFTIKIQFPAFSDQPTYYYKRTLEIDLDQIIQLLDYNNDTDTQYIPSVFLHF